MASALPVARVVHRSTGAQAARGDFERRHVWFEYLNVRKHAGARDQMLKHSPGGRLVPVIVEDGWVTIGFGGT